MSINSRIDKNTALVRDSVVIVDGKMAKLNIQQRLFCHYYTTEGETFRCAYKSYALAYDFPLPLTDTGSTDFTSPEYRSVQAASSKLYSMTKIQLKIEQLMLAKLNNNSVDSRLSGIIHQGKDTDSLTGIKIYNDLNSRVARNLNINVIARPYQNMSDEDLEKIANEEISNETTE